MAGTFDFAPKTHVAEEMAPPEASSLDMNSWEFTTKPATPYRRKFKLTIGGMRWYLAAGSLDVVTNPTLNAGRLLNFYRSNRTWDSFTYAHEYLGPLTCRFAEPVNIPKALQNSGGLVPEFEIVLVHHNPSFTL